MYTFCSYECLFFCSQSLVFEALICQFGFWKESQIYVLNFESSLSCKMHAILFSELQPWVGVRSIYNPYRFGIRKKLHFIFVNQREAALIQPKILFPIDKNCGWHLLFQSAVSKPKFGKSKCHSNKFDGLILKRTKKSLNLIESSNLEIDPPLLPYFTSIWGIPPSFILWYYAIFFWW